MSEVVHIGDATLYLGDCLEILPTLGRVDAVVTDPPWRASKGRISIRKAGDNLGVASCQSSQSLSYGDIGEFSAEALRLAAQVSSNDILVLCGYMELFEVIRSVGKLRGVLVWHNTRPTPLPGVVSRRDVAFVVWGGESSLAGKNGRRWASCLFSHGSPQGGCMATERIKNKDGSTAHPAQEPINLFEQLISPLGELILDPYMGTGTTGAACANLGRKFIGIEIEKKYFDIACERIEAAYAQGRLFA